MGESGELERRERTCTRKRTIGGKASAEARAKRTGGYAYLCPYCGLWHVSSTPPQREGGDRG